MAPTAAQSSSPRAQLSNWLGFYFLLNLPILAWIAYYYVSHVTRMTLHAAYFSGMMMFGHIPLLFMAVLLFAVALPWLLYPKRWLFYCVAVLAATLTLCLLAIDTQAYAHYRVHVQWMYFKMLFSRAGQQIFDMSWYEYATIFFIAGVGLLGQITLGVIAQKMVRRFKIRHMLRYMLCMVGGITLIAYSYFIIASIQYRQDVIRQAKHFPLFYGIASVHYLADRDLIHLKNHDLMVRAANLKREDPLQYPLAPIVYQSSAPKYNVLMIVIDSWRQDTMNPIATPHIAKFAARSTQFRQHMSGGNCTSAGIFSLFYGLPYNYWRSVIVHHNRPLWLNMLIKQGYALKILSSASMADPPFAETIFHGLPNINKFTPGQTPDQRDAVITHEMLQFLDEMHLGKKNFFGFLFYDSMHAYSFPKTMKTPFNPWWRTMNRFLLGPNFPRQLFYNRYQNAAYYVDGLIAEVLQRLKQKKLLDNTIVIITADHGEAFNDNQQNFWGHNSQFSHHQLATPFIVHWPGKKPRQLHYPTRHVDLAPTLMQELLHVSNPSSDYSIGYNFWKNGDRPFTIAHSYTDLAVLFQQKIMRFFPNGFYQLRQHDHFLPLAKRDKKIVSAALDQMERYYIKQ